MSIIFYDIDSKLAPKPGPSPFTMKVRYALNFKGLQYQTVHLGYPEIEATCKKIGAAPTARKPNGDAQYTLPVIRDTSTGVILSDSDDIIQYLDKTYPSPKLLFPEGTVALQLAFNDVFFKSLGEVYAFGTAQIPKLLKPGCETFWRASREARLGKRVEEIEPKGEARVVALERFKAALGQVDSWISKSGGPYVTGEEMVFVDIAIGATLASIKIILEGERADIWNEIASWHDGRWETFRKACEVYHK